MDGELEGQQDSEPEASLPATAGGLVQEEFPDLRHFWPSLLTAIGTEPRDIKSLRGGSGLEHRLVAVGLDENRKRLVVISDDADAESAAMTQADLQAAQRDVQVVLARAVLLNLGAVGEVLTEKLGRAQLIGEDLKALQAPPEAASTPEADRYVSELLEPIFGQIQTARGVGLPDVLQSVLAGIFKQLFSADWQNPESPQDPILDLSSLIAGGVIARDADVGVCAIPVYDFSADELELINKATDAEEIRKILTRHGLYQYFFPPADQTALGLIDRGGHLAQGIVDTVRGAPALGHPFGPDELVPEGTDLIELLDQLKDRKLAAEVDLGWELTPEGRVLRAEVRAKPREGLISKLINRVSLRINIKSLFKM